MEKIFRSEDLCEAIEKKGFALASGIISTDLLDEMNSFGKEYIKSRTTLPKDTAANYLPRPAETLAITQVRKTVEHHLQQQFIGHKVIGLSLLNKKPHQPLFGLHPHPMMVDIRYYRAFTIWIPTLDVDGTNGALWMLPNVFSDYINEFHPSNLKECSELVPMKKGDVLFFDNRLHHWSDVNVTDTDRLALVFVAIPEEAKLITHRIRKENSKIIIDLYDIYEIGKEYDKDFLICKTPYESFVYEKPVRTVTATGTKEASNMLSKILNSLPKKLRNRFKSSTKY